MSTPQARNDSAVESSDANYAYFALFAAIAAAVAFLLRFTAPAAPLVRPQCHLTKSEQIDEDN